MAAPAAPAAPADTSRAWTCSGGSNAALVANLHAAGFAADPRVRRAMLATDRALFVPPLRLDQRKSKTYEYGPYCDSPQPLGYKATVSAPWIHAVALTELADHVVRPGARVLDVGCGSGIMMAYFYHMAAASSSEKDSSTTAAAPFHVVGVETIRPLSETSLANLAKAGLGDRRGLVVRHGDGWQGFPEFGPFDAIHVGAYAADLPPSLVSQLKPGGRMILPVGEHMKQQFTRVDKDLNGVVTTTKCCDVRFVPLKKSPPTVAAAAGQPLSQDSPSVVDWDARYRKGWAYGKEANAFLVEAFRKYVAAAAQPIPDGPLDVLCLGAGQGRNAVYLASLGHRCVALDASEMALRKAVLLCSQRLREGAWGRLTTVHCDLSHEAEEEDDDDGGMDGEGNARAGKGKDDGEDDCVGGGSARDRRRDRSFDSASSHDVVVDIFSSLDPITRRRALRWHVSRGLRPGGLYIAECFAPRHDAVRDGRACGPAKHCLVSAAQLAKDLGPSMEILLSEELEMRINEGRFHRGMCVVTRLVARKLLAGPRCPTFEQTMRSVFDESARRYSNDENSNKDIDDVAVEGARLASIGRASAEACLDAENGGGDADGAGRTPDRLLFSASASVRIACTVAASKDDGKAGRTSRDVREGCESKGEGTTSPAHGRCQLCWLPPAECLCSQIFSAAATAAATRAPTLLPVRFSVLCHPQEFLRSTSTAKIAVQVLGPERAQMLVVGGGAVQRGRLQALLRSSSSALPQTTATTFVLFPHAPQGEHTMSVSEMMQQLSPSSTTTTIDIIVPDGSWECCRAMVEALHERQTLDSAKRICYVRLDEDRVAAYHSPLIEALKAGQGQGRISTLEAIALFLDEASNISGSEGAAATTAAAPAAAAASGMAATPNDDNGMCPLASVLIQQGLMPLVTYITQKKTAAAFTAVGRPCVIRKVLKKQWVDALRHAAATDGTFAPATFSPPPLGARYCSLCGETLATPIRFAEHTRGKKHCDKVLRQMLLDPEAGANMDLAPPTDYRARKVYQQYSALPLSRLSPEPPDVALVHVLEGLRAAKAQALAQAARTEADEAKLQAAKLAKRRSKKAKFRPVTKGEALLRQKKSQPANAFRLPEYLRAESKLQFNGEEGQRHDMRSAVVSFLQRAGSGFGAFAHPEACVLEEFVPSRNVFRNFSARQLVYQAVKADEEFLAAYTRLVLEVVVPHLSERLRSQGKSGKVTDEDKTRTFHYQYPPTLRLQPGPSQEYGRVHRDAEYGHQDGELNFWMPLSLTRLTQTSLLVESAPNKGDFRALDVEYGEISMFHGTLCHHKAPPNLTPHTRVSLDFRIGVGEFFDATWKMEGIKAQHGRRSVRVLNV
jgi:protein-L-isoaspartate(D-aspartate) O-methyltransferase